MHVTTLITGAYEENCYLLWNEEKKALLIDPGDDAHAIVHIIQEYNLQIAAYVCTHAHADHISALHEVHKRYPAPIAMHTLDWDWAFSAINQSPPYYAQPKEPTSYTRINLDEQQKWTFGPFELEVIHTPGHTPGSCCFICKNEEILIAGDTLFKGSCGRTDLPGGDALALKKSLQHLKQLTADYRILAGHGDETTLQVERATNFYLQ
jgi:hydroxyacylglutathione hydrolase